MIHPTEAVAFSEPHNPLPVFDVRSHSEYAEGHIPGAINLPLFDDEERRKVGILYKSSGKEAAILEGLGIAGQKLQQLVKQARRFAPSRRVRLHCWRGGMRSESVAWLLSTAGFEVYLLIGGYKAYRQYIRESWSRPAQLRVISGKTGTGKSEILREIESLGHQVLDLEKMAHHKGSAFGALGELPQPTSEQFENNLIQQWLAFDFSRPIWLEDESRFIGRVNVPEPLYTQKQAALTFCLDIPHQQRIARLVDDYASFPPEMLADAITRIEKRLGGQHAKAALQAVYDKDFPTAIDIVLHFYDKTYAYDLTKKTSSTIFHILSNTARAAYNAQKLLDEEKQLQSQNP